MKAIVFGGSGFLGSHIADELSQNGFETLVFDKNPSRHISRTQEMVVGDIRDYGAVREALRGCDYVYNYAGLADLNEGSERPLDTIELNILGNANVMQACVEEGVKRFIYASTIYVYSQKGGFYRCSKQSSEIYLEEYNRKYGLNYTILRYGTLYGPRADGHNSIYKYLKKAITEGRISCSNPEEMREYIHVRDASKLSVEILEEKYNNSRIILSGHYYMKVSDMLNIIKEILNDNVHIDYTAIQDNSDHYNFTPYSFSPKIGQKMVGNVYTDIGQGLLECLDDIYQEGCLPLDLERTEND